MINYLQGCFNNTPIGMLPTIINHNNLAIEDEFNWIFDSSLNRLTKSVYVPTGSVTAHNGEFINLLTEFITVKNLDSLVLNVMPKIIELIDDDKLAPLISDEIKKYFSDSANQLNHNSLGDRFYDALSKELFNYAHDAEFIYAKSGGNVLKKLDLLDTSINDIDKKVSSNDSSIKIVYNMYIPNIYDTLNTLDTSVNMRNVNASINDIRADIYNIHDELNIIDSINASISNQDASIRNVSANIVNIYDRLDEIVDDTSSIQCKFNDIDASISNQKIFIRNVSANIDNIYNRLNIIDTSINNIDSSFNNTFNNFSSRISTLESSNKLRFVNIEEESESLGRCNVNMYEYNVLLFSILDNAELIVKLNNTTSMPILTEYDILKRYYIKIQNFIGYIKFVNINDENLEVIIDNLDDIREIECFREYCYEFEITENVNQNEEIKSILVHIKKYKIE